MMIVDNHTQCAGFVRSSTVFHIQIIMNTLVLNEKHHISIHAHFYVVHFKPF